MEGTASGRRASLGRVWGCLAVVQGAALGVAAQSTDAGSDEAAGPRGGLPSPIAGTTLSQAIVMLGMGLLVVAGIAFTWLFSHKFVVIPGKDDDVAARKRLSSSEGSSDASRSGSDAGSDSASDSEADLEMGGRVGRAGSASGRASNRVAPLPSLQVAPAGPPAAAPKSLLAALSAMGAGGGRQRQRLGRRRTRRTRTRTTKRMRAGWMKARRRRRRRLRQRHHRHRRRWRWGWRWRRRRGQASPRPGRWPRGR